MEYLSRIKELYRNIVPFKVRVKIWWCRLFVTNYHEYEKTKYWSLKKKSFGKLNPDKTFYILRKYPKAMGLLSCYLAYLGHLELIKDKKYIPMIDMITNYYPVVHNSEHDANLVNAWEQYFDQLSKFDLKEIYNSRNVILGYGFTPDNARELFDATVMTDEIIEKWHIIDKKHMRLNNDLEREFNEEYESKFGSKRIIGVMIREGYQKANQLGMEMIKGHPAQPDLEMVIQDLHDKLNKWNCDYIYLSTESLQTLETMLASFGNKLIYTNRIRRDMSANNYNDYLKKSQEYLNSMTVEQRNIDYLKEVYLLSKCTCLVGGKASATLVASIWNGNKYEHRLFYELGLY